MFHQYRFVFFALFFMIFISLIGCTEERPPARLERERLACPINADFKTMLDDYFVQHPRPPRKKCWHRAIVLKKNREFTDRMNVSFVIYSEKGEIRTLKSSILANDSELDLKTPVGGEIWFCDNGRDKFVSQGEVEIISEQAICLPDGMVIEESFGN